MGGPTAPRKEHPISLTKCWSDKNGRYGEPIGEKVIGVESLDSMTVTREHEWEIKKEGPLGPLEFCQ